MRCIDSISDRPLGVAQKIKQSRRSRFALDRIELEQLQNSTLRPTARIVKCEKMQPPEAQYAKVLALDHLGEANGRSQ